jgi:geranylgeranyl reductase family protein
LDRRRYDALVVGAGPAGSVAALTLARGGARVALVDKASFPRDKACGDLIGPRGVRLLADLGIEVGGATRVDDMVVVGPSGRRVSLPCLEGTTYPGYAVALPRSTFDDILYAAAVGAGAEPVTARADMPRFGAGGELDGFDLDDGSTARADTLIGADGATSRVAEVAGLVDAGAVLWGFAVRGYVDDPLAVPHIVFWEPSPRRAFPGYGWAFPGVDGRANLGLGLGVLSARAEAGRAARAFASFVADLRRLTVVAPAGAISPVRGGWLKMGMVGTAPARGRVLLAGDAAGLVNPLQGEGIAQAMASGRAAAEAVLAGPGRAGGHYRRFLAGAFRPYQSTAAAVHRAIVPRPGVVAGVGRVLTAPVVGRAVAGGWSIFWNDLIDGARPSRARDLAASVSRLGGVLSRPGPTGRWFARNFADDVG